MLEVASWPSDLCTWDPGGGPFYLELEGETRPLVDRAGRAMHPARRRHDAHRSEDADAVSTGAAAANAAAGNGSDPDSDHLDGDHAATVGGPVYEYAWTLGHPGDEGKADPWWHQLRAPRGKAWDSLDDPAARVYLYLPTQGGWRADELAATLTYLAPTHHQEDLHDKAADDWSKIQPVLSGASDLAGKLGPVPGLGPVAAGVAPTLAAAAKLQLHKLPQNDTYAWTVAKVATRTEQDGFLQGVVWTLPRQVFTDLGSRLTGALAVTVQASTYQQGGVPALEPTLAPRAALVRAVIHHDGTWTSIPGGDDEFVRLVIEPRLV